MKKKLECILLVDDDHSVNFLNEKIIAHLDCAERVKVCTGAGQALQYLKNAEGRHLPNLIFLDINMPAMNGWEFLEEYNKLGNHLKSKIVIVILTTSLNPEDNLRSQRIPEINDFISKPITIQLLDGILKKHFVDHF